MARKYRQSHYEDVAAVLRDVLNSPGADHYTIAKLTFQFGKLFEHDSRGCPTYFDETRFVRAIFPGDERSDES
jgi:hypothetical protein